MESEDKIVGQCPICERDMVMGSSIDKHHFTPKSEGGKATLYVHRVCHSKIHSLFTNKELSTHYDTPEKLKENIHIQRFIKFVAKKGPSFYERSKRRKTKYR